MKKSSREPKRGKDDGNHTSTRCVRLFYAHTIWSDRKDACKNKKRKTCPKDKKPQMPKYKKAERKKNRFSQTVQLTIRKVLCDA